MLSLVVWFGLGLLATNLKQKSELPRVPQIERSPPCNVKHSLPNLNGQVIFTPTTPPGQWWRITCMWQADGVLLVSFTWSVYTIILFRHLWCCHPLIRKSSALPSSSRSNFCSRSLRTPPAESRSVCRGRPAPPPQRKYDCPKWPSFAVPFGTLSNLASLVERKEKE